MFIVLTWDELVQAYEEYCTSTLPHLCSHCHCSRQYAGGHWRWVLWAASDRRPLWLRHVRCEDCHTLETVFPPWLLPYEEWTLMVLQQALDAVLDEGWSFARVAAAWGVDREAVVRRVTRWRDQAPALRQIVAQKAAAWEAAPPGSTWQPRPQSRSWDWSWLLVAWTACFVALWDEATVTKPWVRGTLGLPAWRLAAPEALPAACVSAWTHLGRRIRQGPGPPTVAVGGV